MLQLFGELKEMLRIWLLLAVVAQIKPTAVPVWAQQVQGWAQEPVGFGSGKCWHTVATPFYLHG